MGMINNDTEAEAVAESLFVQASVQAITAEDDNSKEYWINNLNQIAGWMTDAQIAKAQSIVEGL
jgi:hypothetical protein